MLFANNEYDFAKDPYELGTSFCALRKPPGPCNGYHIDAELRGGSNGEVFRVAGATLAVEKQLASDEASQKKCTTSEKQLYFLDKTKGLPL